LLSAVEMRRRIEAFGKRRDRSNDSRSNEQRREVDEMSVAHLKRWKEEMKPCVA